MDMDIYMRIDFVGGGIERNMFCLSIPVFIHNNGKLQEDDIS